jgi:hypothetical protein
MLALLLYFSLGARPAVAEIATELVLGTFVLDGGGGGRRRRRRRRLILWLRLWLERLRRRPVFA